MAKTSYTCGLFPRTYSLAYSQRKSAQFLMPWLFLCHLRQEGTAAAADTPLSRRSCQADVCVLLPVYSPGHLFFPKRTCFSKKPLDFSPPTPRSFLAGRGSRRRLGRDRLIFSLSFLLPLVMLQNTNTGSALWTFRA
jgi:hypothetical protein